MSNSLLPLIFIAMKGMSLMIQPKLLMYFAIILGIRYILISIGWIFLLSSPYFEHPLIFYLCLFYQKGIGWLSKRKQEYSRC